MPCDPTCECVVCKFSSLEKANGETPLKNAVMWGTDDDVRKLLGAGFIPDHDLADFAERYYLLHKPEVVALLQAFVALQVATCAVKNVTPP